MRQEEISRIRWSDVDVEQRIVLVRDRKDPREKDGNDQWVPLLNLAGFAALRLIRVQRKYDPRGDRIFPYNPRSVGTAFRRACPALNIANLHFPHLRHEPPSRPIQWVPLRNLAGFDALRLIRVQRKYDPRGDRIFPYNPRSVGTAFRRACRALKIENLHFHDLRHEATSRLFEAGLRIEQVALVTGHRDWKMLKRYTHLRPEHLYRDKARRPAEDMAEVVRAAVRSLASELHVSPAQQHSPAEAKADMLQEAAPLLRQLAALLLDQDSPPPSAPPPSARPRLTVVPK